MESSAPRSPSEDEDEDEEDVVAFDDMAGAAGGSPTVPPWVSLENWACGEASNASPAQGYR